MVPVPSGVPASIEPLARLVLDSHLEALAARLAAAIQEQLDEYRGIEGDELFDSCRRNLARSLQYLGGVLPDAGSLVDAPAETGRHRARQGLALDALLTSYRLGGRFLWTELVARADEVGIDPRVMLTASTAVWEIIEVHSSAAASAYRDEEASLQRRGRVRLDIVLDGLLDGDGHDRAFAERAAAVMQTSVDASYLVVASAPDPAGPGHLGEILGRHGLTAHWRIRSGVEACVVELATELPQDVAEVLRASAGGAAALSPVVSGLAQVGYAFQLAEAALRTLRAGDDVALFTDRLPEVLLVSLPDVAAGLRRQALGPLLALPAAERDVLVATLRESIVEGKPTHAVARALYCHRNTVLSRLDRVATLTGRRLDDPRHRLLLHLALLSLELGPTDD